MIPVRIAVERTFRAESGAVLASLIRILGQFDLAEDALMDALASALDRWPEEGIPDKPGAWITTVARRKAIDRLRRDTTVAKKAASVSALAQLEAEERRAAEAGLDERPEIPDDQLRLIFTCCHPSLSREAQVALTLRTLGGLSTAEIAAAFLTPVPTMAQRLVRAKNKIQRAKIPYEVPPPEAWPERLSSVLAVVYLVFNEGYFAREGPSAIRPDVCDEAIRLGRVLVRLLGEEPEVLGLLGLMLLHDSRRAARDHVLEEQDRATWDAAKIEQGIGLTKRALGMRRPGPYQLQAAIAAVHAEAPSFADTDWRQIAALYGVLAGLHPSPIVELNRAVAVSMADGPEAGLAVLARLDHLAELRDHQPYHAARADILRRAGRTDAAIEAYERALAAAPNEVAREFLSRRLGTLLSS
jgi:RNA polymerase sigma-70 factor (ECF subfamily)